MARGGFGDAARMIVVDIIIKARERTMMDDIVKKSKGDIFSRYKLVDEIGLEIVDEIRTLNSTKQQLKES